MSWKKIGLKTNLQKSLSICERNGSYFGDGCDENFHYGESLAGGGWGGGFVESDGNGTAFLISDNLDDDENLLLDGDGWGNASGFFEEEFYGSRNGDGISSE